MFTDKIESIIYNVVATMGQKDIIPKSIGKVSWSWNDDEGQLHTNKFNNILYFPYPPVNILSENALGESIKYDELTWVLTKSKYYIFICYFVKYKKIIAHSEKFLPELYIQAGFSTFSVFCKIVGYISIYSTFNFSFASICTMEEPRTGNPMNFTPYIEDEVVREGLSHT